MINYHRRLNGIIWWAVLSKLRCQPQQRDDSKWPERTILQPSATVDADTYIDKTTFKSGAVAHKRTQNRIDRNAKLIMHSYSLRRQLAHDMTIMAIERVYRRIATITER